MKVLIVTKNQGKIEGVKRKLLYKSIFSNTWKIRARHYKYRFNSSYEQYLDLLKQEIEIIEHVPRTKVRGIFNFINRE